MRVYLKLTIAAAVLLAAGCTTLLNNRRPFSDFVGKEVVLARPAALQEFIAGSTRGEIRTYWENGKPTEFVYDERLFARAAKTTINDIKQEYSLYPAADYPKCVYSLWDNPADASELNYRKNYGGPYREYELPAGTKVFIKKAYTFNGIDNIRQEAEGLVTIPGTSRVVKFIYTFSSVKPSRGTTSEYIGRAPWEGESVPEARFVGWNGKMYDPNK